MFKNTYPLFERKKILKKEMLENLRDYPRDIFRILYQDYSDGILAGCRLKVQEPYVCVEPGILYYNKEFYIMNSPYRLLYEPKGEVQYIKVRFLEMAGGVEKKEAVTQIYIDGTPPDKKDELELARFKLQKGARLRDQYTSFYDFATEFDTLNLIYAPYASPGKCTVNPKISKSYAVSMMKYSVNNAWDCAFCLNCLQEGGTLPHATIQGYLNIRLKQEKETYQPAEIYDAFQKLLAKAEGSGRSTEHEVKTNRKMLLLQTGGKEMFLDEKLLQIESSKSEQEKREQHLTEIRDDILRQELEQKTVEDRVRELKSETVEIEGREFLCEKRRLLDSRVPVFIFPEDVDRIFEENNVATVFYRTLEIGTNLTFVNQPAVIKNEAEFQKKITEQYLKDKLTYYPLETGNFRSGNYRICYAEGVLTSAVGGVFINSFYCSGKKRTITGNYTCRLAKRYIFEYLFQAMVSQMF